MTSATAAPQLPGSKKFQVGPVAITVDGDKESLAALATDKPFSNWQVALGGVSAAASTGDNISLSSPTGTVKFAATAEAGAGFGLYTDPAKLVADLHLDDNLSDGLTLPTASNFGFCVFHWGYDLEGSISGSVALGAPASVKFGVDGARSATYAVVRRFDRSTSSTDVIQGTLDNWRMPSAVTSADLLSPGTWLIAETDGALALKLGASYGYDFNWVRQMQLGTLSGDIGLKLNAAISVALGFTASGRYAVVVSREPDDQASIRLRLFKLRKKGWSFSFNGGFSVKGKETVAKPGEFDSFVQAIFGIHGLQVVNDLHALRDWTDPNMPLTDRLAEFGLEHLKGFLTDVTQKDPKDARGEILGWLEKWDALPANIASLLWSHAPDQEGLTRISDIARQIADLNQESVHAQLVPHLEKSSFFQTPLGKWLDAAAEGQVLNALTGIQEFQRLKEIASKTADVLDGDDLRSFLKTLHDKIDKRLRIDQIEEAIQMNDISKLHPWFRSRLAAVLGPVDRIEALREARKVIDTLLSKAPEFYDKAVKALNDTYKFSVSATYESTTSSTALIDASFDLRATNASERYKDVLNGYFDEFLIQKAPGIVLHSATLTHNLKRQEHVEVSLPFYSMNTTEITNSLTKMRAVDGAEGRVLLYDLKSQDEVREKNRRDSRLAIAAFYPTGDIRKYGLPTMSCSYAYRFQRAGMKRTELHAQLKPYLDAYLPGHFPDNGDGSLSAWLGDLDKYIDAHSFNGTDNFGDVRFALDVALPPELASFWLRLDPSRTRHRFFEMSRRIQAALRRLILSHHFADPMRYADLGAAPALLVYSALPVSTQVEVDDGEVLLDRLSGVYWDYADPDILRPMVRDWRTAANLAGILRGVSDVVRSIPELNGVGEFYTPDQAHVFQSMALGGDGHGQFKLRSLLRNESILIDSAVDASKKMLEFLKSKDRPSKAIAILTAFGDKVTSSFNGLEVYTGGAIRPLGPTLLAVMAEALCPGSVPTRPRAMLSLMVMKNGKSLPAITDAPTAEDVVIEQRIVSA